jgi:hypothetical protein
MSIEFVCKPQEGGALWEVDVGSQLEWRQGTVRDEDGRGGEDNAGERVQVGIGLELADAMRLRTTMVIDMNMEVEVASRLSECDLIRPGLIRCYRNAWNNRCWKHHYQVATATATATTNYNNR